MSVSSEGGEDPHNFSCCLKGTIAENPVQLDPATEPQNGFLPHTAVCDVKLLLHSLFLTLFFNFCF